MSFYGIWETPRLRKLKYVEKVAVPEVARDWFFRFNLEWDLLSFFVGWSILFRFYLDLYLSLDLHLDCSDFKLNPLDVLEELEPITLDQLPEDVKESLEISGFPVPRELLPQEVQENYEEVGKGYYGKSKYGYAIYDPPSFLSGDIEGSLWDLTYKTTSRVKVHYKHISKTLKDYISIVKDQLRRKGVSERVLSAIEAVVSIAEGKVLDSAYWDCAVWGLDDVGLPWKEVQSESSIFNIRNIEDWKTQLPLETFNPYEEWWDIATWDYSRWYGEGYTYPVTLGDYLEEKVNEWLRRVSALHQAVFILQRTDRMHVKGGYHQVRQQHFIKAVSRLLDMLGVSVLEKKNYIAFALELKYVSYSSSRHYKLYKKKLSKEDIIEKWLRLGLDRNILEKIASMVWGR